MILMRTLALAILMCVLLSGSSIPSTTKDKYVSIEQEFYVFGSYEGTATKLFKISISDSVIEINSTIWPLEFVRKKQNTESYMLQYSSTDNTTIKMYYEGQMLVDISLSKNYTTCHFLITNSYLL